MDSMQALVIDDTSGYRALLSDVLSGITGVEVQGVAASGKTGLSRATAQTPDLVLVDVGLADIGLPELLNDLRALDESIGVILIDVDDLKPATVTLALKLSALGAVGRPSLQDERGRGDLAAELRRMIDGFQTRRLLRGTRTGSTSPSRPVSTSDALPDNTTSKPASPAIPKVTETLIPDLPLEVIGIGISTGGPNALAELLPALPGDLPVPILIVQHITDTFTASLVKSLDGKSRLAIFEGQEGVVPVAGAVYVAPGGRQMKVELKDAQARLRITDDPPVNHCKPAVDYLFDSISTVYGARALGVIMTGMGADGAAGLVAMRRAGARVLAQDEATSMIYGMPGAAVRAGVVDCILPLDQLAPVITRLAMAVPDPEVSSADLHRIALFVRERCGINLDETKGYLVQSRWRRLCQDYGGLTPTQLVERAHRGDEGLASLLIDTISTKETSFF
ncbi:MAG: response regulator, partial [Gemmatimonadetes bacterium]|nr:response regulator [Gemmatimonadota bacterium]